MKVEALAKAMIDLFLAHLIVGDEEEVKEEDVMFWALLYFEGLGQEDELKRAQRMTREILAYKRALQRLRGSPAGRPENVAALIIYNISHSGPKDLKKRELWENKVARNYSYSRIRDVEEALDLIEEVRGTYLTERAISEFMGRMVNLDRVARFVEEEYEVLVAKGEGNG